MSERWASKRLESVIEILDHLRVPVNSDERATRAGTIPYYGANGQQGWINRSLFNEPLVLLAEDGGHFDDFATRPIAYRIDGPSWVNNHAHIIRAGAGTAQDFLFWSLVNRDVRRYIAGGTRTKLTQAELRSIEISLPPLPEQQRIAEVLDTVDEAIRKTEQIIDKLKQVKQGLLHDLLTWGIDNNGEVRDPERHPEQFSDSPLGQIPKSWTIARVADLCESVIDCPHSTPVFTAEGVLIARTSHIRAGCFDIPSASRVSESEYKKRIARLEPQPGDIIFTREAPVGEAFVIPAGMRICLGQRVMLLRPNAPRLSPHYFVAQVYSGVVARRIELLTGGTTNPHLNVVDVREFRIPVPPLQEQARIVAALREIDRRLESEGIVCAKLRLIKQALMSDLLTGRVRVQMGVTE